MVVPATPRTVPRDIIGAAVLIELAYVAQLVGVGGISALTSAQGLVGIGVTLPFLVGSAYAGYWLDRSGLSTERYPRVFRWCLAGTAVYLALNLVLIAGFSPWEGLTNLGWVVFAIQIGFTGGLALGIIEARAIERAVAAEREATRAEQLEEQRDWFEYLNSLLRHEVLNSAHLINGYVDLLQEELPRDHPRREYLSRIGRRSNKMSEVIQDVRVLLQATEDHDDLEPVDLVTVLADEVQAILDEHDGIYVDTSLPESAPVPADDLLARVFSNVLANAVEHNDSEQPMIGVSVTTDDDTVRVEIADNGPGIPAGERARLFERESPGDHGLGLYLVDRLVDRFGGTIDLTETGPDGTIFTIELPLADVEDATAAEASVVVPDAP